MRQIDRILLRNLKRIPNQELYQALIAIGEGEYQFDNKILSKLSPDELALRVEYLMIKSNLLSYNSDYYKPYYINSPRMYSTLADIFSSNIHLINIEDYKTSFKVDLEYQFLKFKAKFSNIMLKFIPQKIIVLILIFNFILSQNSNVLKNNPEKEVTYNSLEIEECVQPSINKIQIYKQINEYLKERVEMMDGNPDIDMIIFTELLEILNQNIDYTDVVVEEIEKDKEENIQEEIPVEETNDILEYDTLNEKYLNDELTMLAKNHHIRSVTYMYYTDITSPTSPQYHLLKNMNLISYHEAGFIQIGDYYAVALGSKFGPIGSRYIIIDDAGNEIKIIKAEEKSDIHTINGFAHAIDHSIIEFLINPKNEVIKEIVNQGDNYPGRINNHCKKVFSGRIDQIFSVTDDGLINLIEERSNEYNLDQSLKLTKNN